MTKKLQHVFALSEKGAKDLVKAVIWCFVCNVSLMIPVGVVLFTVQHLLDSMENENNPGEWILDVYGSCRSCPVFAVSSSLVPIRLPLSGNL